MYKRLICGLAAVLLSGSVFGQLTVYQGYDDGWFPGDPIPGSDAARADFIANLPSTPLMSIDFESVTLQPVRPGPATIGLGVNVTMLNQRDEPAQGITDIVIYSANTTPGGKNFLNHVIENPDIPSSTTFDFDVPIQAFGTNLTGVQSAFGSWTVRFDDGSAQEVSLEPELDQGAAFFGFIDPLKFITSVTFHQVSSPSTDGDYVGFDDLLVAQSSTEARFHVTKIFNDESTDEVDVKLTCNDGFISQNGEATIVGGDLAGHTFIVTHLSSQVINCEITESGGPAGYDTVMNGCTWEPVTDTHNLCRIINMAKPAEYTVTKDWDITNNGGNAVNEKVKVTIECSEPILKDQEPAFVVTNGTGPYTKSGYLGDGDSMTARVSTAVKGGAMCKAYEDIIQSGVESENGCESYTNLTAGEKHRCTIYNTVFFEGIPTLSQYGMAIMALLMLGIGFVGFRRFI